MASVRTGLSCAGSRHLELHRIIGQGLDGEWNPAPVLQEALPEFKKLQVFSLEPDDPHRQDHMTPRSPEDKNARCIRRLQAMAEEIILMTHGSGKSYPPQTTNQSTGGRRKTTLNHRTQDSCSKLPYLRLKVESYSNVEFRDPS
ncbi:hypothetical protein FB451DRAFT_1369856 [Mycena latifolia]|nr:hypothetical protein FB451DRAFT_1369856 [Mycena latifolia]